MKTICAWCGATIHENTDLRDSRVSHGLCATCERCSDDKLDELARSAPSIRRHAELLKKFGGTHVEI